MMKFCFFFGTVAGLTMRATPGAISADGGSSAVRKLASAASGISASSESAPAGKSLSSEQNSAASRIGKLIEQANSLYSGAFGASSPDASVIDKVRSRVAELSRSSFVSDANSLAKKVGGGKATYANCPSGFSGDGVSCKPSGYKGFCNKAQTFESLQQKWEFEVDCGAKFS